MRALSGSPPAHPRRTRVPPALTWGSETLPASAVLDELPDGLGVLLWRSARNARLWAATPPARRGRLFDPAAAPAREGEVREAAPDPELLAPLSVMVRMLEAPAELDEARVVNACRRLALWAEQRGALGTALEFAQAAALTAPHVAALAYAVGRLARRRAEYDRAESWLARAVVQGRRTEDWHTYALAYSGLGNLNVQKGNFPLARRAHERALRTALRHNLRDLQGSAYHDLFLAAVETASGTEAEGMAEQALVAYGSRHSNLPRLAFDLAYHWILNGSFRDALKVAESLEPHFVSACDRALVTSMIARASAGSGERSAFDVARERLNAILASDGSSEAAARALLGVAQGAAALADWDLAARYAESALHIATERREGRIVLAAEKTLTEVRGRIGSSLDSSAQVSGLANLFVAALSEITDDAAIAV